MSWQLVANKGSHSSQYGNAVGAVAGAAYAGLDTDRAYSSIAGAAWKASSSFAGTNAGGAFAVAVVAANDVWVLEDASGGDLFHWNGTVWSTGIAQPVGVSALNMFAISGAVYLVDEANGWVYVSVDTGSTWTKIFAATSLYVLFGTAVSIYGLFVVAANDVWVTDKGAGYAYHWNGAAWSQKTPGAASDLLYAVWASGVHVYVAGSTAAGAAARIYHSSNSGGAWTQEGPTTANVVFRGLFGNATEVYAGAQVDSNCLLYRCTGRLDNWAPDPLPVSAPGITSSVVYAGWSVSTTQSYALGYTTDGLTGTASIYQKLADPTVPAHVPGTSTTDFTTIPSIPAAANSLSDYSNVQRYTGSWQHGTMRLEIGGTFVATVTVQESLDGSTFVTATDIDGVLLAGLSAPGIYAMKPTHFVRLLITSYTSGTVTGMLLGPTD